MPVCLAVGCLNKSGKNDTNHYFKIPDPKKDSELCSRWLHNIGNAKWNIRNFEAKPHRVVCGEHFHSDCFERDLMFELMPDQANWQRKMILRTGAIPTVFKHKVFDIINLDGNTVSLKLSASRKRSLSLERTEVL